MSRRTIAILIFVVGILLLSIVGVVFILQQNQPTPATPTETAGEEGAPPPDGTAGEQPVSELPPMVEVVVSLQTVPRGFQMTEDILALDMRPAETVGTNVYTNIEDVVGKFARNDLYQGETLTTDLLVNDITLIGENTYGPSSLIPPGFVAQAVPIDRVSSVAYGLSEGDYVDIMVLFQFYEIDQEFQTFLPNDLAFFLEEQIQAVEENPEDPTLLTNPIVFVVTPSGRFEQLATGDLALISPSEFQRPVPVAMIIQNAKVIQVGPYQLPEPASARLATATPESVAEGEPTPTPAVVVPTATPEPPDVVLVALQPQQQLLLRYAMSVRANIDFALRGINDGQLYTVENLDLDFLLQHFNVEVPPNFGFTVDTGGGSLPVITPTPTPAAGTVPEGG